MSRKSAFSAHLLGVNRVDPHDDMERDYAAEGGNVRGALPVLSHLQVPETGNGVVLDLTNDSCVVGAHRNAGCWAECDVKGGEGGAKLVPGNGDHVANGPNSGRDIRDDGCRVPGVAESAVVWRRSEELLGAVGILRRAKRVAKKEVFMALETAAELATAKVRMEEREIP